MNPVLLPALTLAIPSLVLAQIELVPDESTQAFFAGRTAQVQVVFRNATDNTFEADLATRLVQLSSATKTPMDEARPWKKLRVLAGQTVVEWVNIELPAVRAETRFQVEWSDGKRKPGWTREIVAYPDDLLKQLVTLGPDKPIGVIDPDGSLRAELERQGVEFENLEHGTALEKFDGALILAGPFSSKKQYPRHLSDRLKDRASQGLRIVWIQSHDSRPVLSAYPVRVGDGLIVVACGSTLASLAESPTAQLNLVRFAEIALNPNSLVVPETE